MDRQAAATSVPVSLEEMDKVIRRGFRALRPRVEVARWGEVVYLLTPDADDPDSVIRIQTSIMQGSQQARGEGEDSIRITLLNTRTNRPIAEKMQRVHRTQNWKDNLRQRIEDAMETFEELGEVRAKTKQAPAPAARPQPPADQSRTRDERQRQIMMLEALSRSRSYSANAFGDMLNWMQQRPGNFLSPKQLAWAEREYQRIR